MSISVKFVAWFAVLVFVAAIVAARPAIAQEAKEKAVAAAHAAADHAAEDEAGGGPNPLAVDPDLAIWTLIVFVVLFLVLRAFAWPQISAALTEREKRIADTIAAAEAQNAEAKRLLVEHEAKLAAAAGEIRALLEEARRDADVTRKRIETEGHKAAQDELGRALREIDRARDAAIQELAVTSANVAVDLARKVVRDQISPEQQSQIVRDALTKLSAASPSKN